MLRVHQLTLSLDDALHVDDALLRRLCARQLKIKENQIAQVRMAKRSVDARGKEGVHFTLTVDVQLRNASEEEKLAKRRKAIENKADDVKQFLIRALTREDGTSEKFRTARAAVTVKLNPAKVIISDEKLLPEVFFREIIDRKPDKEQIKEVLSRGIEVPGAALERGRSVVIG